MWAPTEVQTVAGVGEAGGEGGGKGSGGEGSVIKALVGVLEQLPPDTLFITGSTQQPVLARFRQYTRELFTAAYILAAAEDKESLLAAETEANAYGIATGRSLNQNTKAVMGHEWLVGATGHVYLFVVTPRLAGGSVDAARAAALVTSAATLASAPPLIVVGSVPRRAPSWLRERLSARAAGAGALRTSRKSAIRICASG